MTLEDVGNRAHREAERRSRAVRRPDLAEFARAGSGRRAGYRHQPADAIDRAEDRERFQHAVDRLKLKQTANATVTAIEQAVEKRKRSATRWWYVLLRAGRSGDGNCSMHEADLRRYFQTAVSVSNDAPVLLDRFP